MKLRLWSAVLGAAVLIWSGGAAAEAQPAAVLEALPSAASDAPPASGTAVRESAAQKQAPRRSARERRVVFESTRNTRDLGGLPTRRGYVRDGAAYRSGALCFATGSDLKIIESLHLKTVIDLRTEKEIRRKEGPDRLPQGALIKTLCLPMAFKGSYEIGRYYSYALDNDSSVRGFFAALARPETYPVLYHCSAGKDRTGVMTALLLELLGTDRPIIMDDYLESKRNSAKLEVHRHWLREIFRLVDEAGGVVPFLVRHGADKDDLKAVPVLLEDRL